MDSAAVSSSEGNSGRPQGASGLVSQAEPKLKFWRNLSGVLIWTE